MTSRARITAFLLALAAFAALALYARSRRAPPARAPVVFDGTASVTIFDEGQRAADRWVVFHDAAGEVTSFAKTGKDGRVTAPIARDGMITVADPSSVRRLLTVTGVEPSDDIVLGEVEDDESVATSVCTARITVPGPYGGAKKHVASLGVGVTEIPDPKEPLKMSVLARYVVDGKFPVLAEALDEGGQGLAFAHGFFSVADGGTVDAPVGPWKSDYRTFAVRVAGGGGAEITGELAIVRGEDRFPRGRRSDPLRFAVPRPLGTNALLRVTLAYGGDRIVFVERRRDMPEAIDLDRGAFPRVESATIEAAANGDRPAVRWAVGGGAAKLDAVVVRITWPETKQAEWTVLQRPEAPSRFVLPALPPELAMFRPDGVHFAAAVALVETSFYDGYRDVRIKGLGLFGDPPEADATSIRYAVTGDLDF